MIIGKYQLGVNHFLRFVVVASSPPLFSAAEDNPYTPTYQFPASTPSPKSEGNYRESCASLLTGTVTSRVGFLLVAEESSCLFASP